jgi:NAD(P)-dependent dehydrogenase (short-subunit alcohol dehydrogenase family)
LLLLIAEKTIRMSAQNGRVDGKVALVTGGASGIGHATAQRLFEEGATVIVGDIEAPEPFDDASVDSVDLYVSNEREWQEAIEYLETSYGELDVLFNNAGVISYEPIDETDLDSWERDVAVNQTGVFLGMKHGIPLLNESGGGSVINTSSIWGIVGAEGAAAYQAIKGAVRNMTKNAAVTYAGDGVRVNLVYPGIVDTPLVRSQDEALSEAVVDATPMDRMADPEEVANGVLYLASDEASFVTGTELVIDGGYLAQ